MTPKPVRLVTRFKWLALSKAASRRLTQICEGWYCTPYHEAQQARGIGIDCIQYIGAVLDELFRSPPTIVPRLRTDTALHSARGSYPSISVLRKAHNGSLVVRDGTIQPGDIIVTRAENGKVAAPRPAHAMIVGADPLIAYHAIPFAGVCKTSFEQTRGIVRVYRPLGKHQWA